MSSSSIAPISTDLAIALDDLSSRFFLNLPKDELDSFERLFFQMEQAWWFYEDFHRENNQNRLPKFNFRDFCLTLFGQSVALRPYVPDFDAHFAEFKDYLGKVPVCGAIILDETMSFCVLVKGWASKSWGFPKGKINQAESSISCAVREVFEEIGVDIEHLVSERHVIQAQIKGKSTSLYIAANLEFSTKFQTQTRKEISDIRWFAVDDLMPDKDNRFWQVGPFLHKLRTWISRHRHLANKSHMDSSLFIDDYRCHSAPLSKQMQMQQSMHKKMLSDLRKKPAAGQHHLRVRSSAAQGRSFDDNTYYRSAANNETFGDYGDGWSPEEMFAANARLFGVRSIYHRVSSGSADASRRASMTAEASPHSNLANFRFEPGFVPAPAVSLSTTSSSLLNFDLDDSSIMSSLLSSMRS